jgi:hypothetical protein
MTEQYISQVYAFYLLLSYYLIRLIQVFYQKLSVIHLFYPFQVLVGQSHIRYTAVSLIYKVEELKRERS